MKTEKICTALNPWDLNEGNVELTPIEAFFHIQKHFERAQDYIVELEQKQVVSPYRRLLGRLYWRLK